MMLTRRTTPDTWMSNFLDDLFLTPWTTTVRHSAPQLNVRENEHEYAMELAAPGLTKEQCNIHLNDDGQLVVKLEDKKEQTDNSNDRYLRHEFRQSNYCQAFLLPKDVNKDAITAHMEHGILLITLPKKDDTTAPANRLINID